MHQNHDIARKGHNLRFNLLLIALAGLTLSACATMDGGSGSENPLKSLATMSGMATPVPDAKDFVKESRPEKLDYIPVGVTPEDAADKHAPLSADELLLLQKKLDAARQKNGATSTAQ